jgi:hypothetical protein
VGVPVPELDVQCWNWNGAKMGSNINIFVETRRVRKVSKRVGQDPQVVTGGMTKFHLT